jgi:hypothetical protein
MRVVLADKITMRSLEVVLGSLFGQPEQLLWTLVEVHPKTYFV